MKYDVTVITTIHAEGRILHRTFRALNRSVDYARQKGVSIEILCILDNCSDPITRNIVKNWQQKFEDRISVVNVEYGAVADARNFGVSQARGEYIALLDGDDLFAEKLLFRSYQACLQDKKVIAHPEAEYLFPVEPFLRFYFADNESFLNLIYSNIFTVRTMAHRDVYLNVPSVRNTDVWAFQDWLWHCDAAVRGYRHQIVPGTIIAVRQKPFAKSLWQNNVARNKVIRPNDLFRQIFCLKFNRPEYRDDSTCKQGIRLLERSVISLLDECYCKNPTAYQFIIGLKRKVWSSFNKFFRKSLQNWILEEIELLAEIEPALSNFRNPTVRFTDTHRRFFNVINKEMSLLVQAKKPKIFILQDLSPESWNAFKSSNHEATGNVFLITTHSFAQRHKGGNNPALVHIDIGNTNLIFEERLNLLHRLLLETEPEFIHIIGSHIAFEMLDRYRATFQNMNVIATLLSPSPNPTKGFSRSGLNWELCKYPNLTDFIDQIQTDSNEHKGRIHEIYGQDNTSIITCKKAEGISAYEE